MKIYAVNNYASTKLNSIKQNPAGLYNYRLNTDSISFTCSQCEAKTARSMPIKKDIRDIGDIEGKKVLMRADFNVSMNKDGTINDAFRIKQALKTINYLKDKGAKTVLISHFGDPAKELKKAKAKNPDLNEEQEMAKIKEKLSLKPVARKLSELLGREVKFVPECTGDKVFEAVNSMKNGDVILLENTRFHPGETKNDMKFAQELASLGMKVTDDFDASAFYRNLESGRIYVNDAFGAAHRAHSSTEGAAILFRTSVAGLLMAKEVDMACKILDNPKRPFTVISAGSKLESKIGPINTLIDRMQSGDNQIIAGLMVIPFIINENPDSPLKKLYKNEEELNADLDRANSIIKKCEQKGVNLIMSKDVTVQSKETKETKTVYVENIEDGWEIMDIGQNTIETIKNTVANSKTVFVNGPVGYFEGGFTNGTKQMLQAIQDLVKNNPEAKTIAGGGDTVTAIVNIFGEEAFDNFTHVSTGGGALLDFLSGKLPGYLALDNK